MYNGNVINYLINYTIMPKVKSYAALVIFIFISWTIVIFVVGLDYSENDTYNQVYKKNEGLIWTCIVIGSLAVFMFGLVHSFYSSEVEKWVKKVIALTKIVDVKNDTIIESQIKSLKIQEKFVDRIDEILTLMNKRTVEEGRLKLKINQLYSLVSRKYKISHKQIGKINAKLIENDKRFKRIEDWISNHDDSIKKEEKVSEIKKQSHGKTI